MTRPPPDSQIDLRAFILYDDYQRKTAGESYENYKKLCDTIGEKAISCDVYRYWCKQYHKEDYLARSKSDSRYIPVTDIRWCILSDVINEKCAEKSIDDLCKAFQELKVDKENHDYWFKRFGNGHLSFVTFSNLPNEIIAEIVGKCDNFESYLALRNVSRRLRAIVDSSKPAFSSIIVEVGDDYIEVTLNNEETLRSEIGLHVEEFNQEDTIMILNHLELILSNPKLQLDILRISHWYLTNEENGPMEMILDVFNSLNHQLHVKHFSFQTPYMPYVPDFVECLKPGVLEKLTVTEQEQPDLFSLVKLFEMEQWKQAKHVIADYLFISVEHFAHFTSFDAFIELFSIEEVVEMIKTSINFKSCILKFMEILDVEALKRVLNLRQTDSPDVFSIPNSNLVIEILPSDDMIEITKI